MAGHPLQAEQEKFEKSRRALRLGMIGGVIFAGVAHSAAAQVEGCYYGIIPQKPAQQELDSFTSADPRSVKVDYLVIPNYDNQPPQNFGCTVTWSVLYSYATSGGKGGVTSMDSFTTATGTQIARQTGSRGGFIEITLASSDTPPQMAYDEFYVAGTKIPASTFTTYLGGLYSTGATPTLLEQIATYESSYAQFTRENLNGVTAYWPTESYDGGSHIGLMQVAVTQGMAVDFDYERNATSGANLFKSNLTLAQKRLNKLATANPGLSAATGEMVENEALSFYNVGTGPSYYVVTQDENGIPQWTENTAGDPTGTAYADCVRAQTVGTRHTC